MWRSSTCALACCAPSRRAAVMLLVASRATDLEILHLCLSVLRTVSSRCCDVTCCQQSDRCGEPPLVPLLTRTCVSMWKNPFISNPFTSCLPFCSPFTEIQNSKHFLHCSSQHSNIKPLSPTLYSIKFVFSLKTIDGGYNLRYC